MCSHLWCHRKGELQRVRLFRRWAEDSVLNSGLCATDITHSLKLADDYHPKRNSGNPTSRQGKTETCIEDPMANQYGIRKRSATEDRQGYPLGDRATLWEAGLLSPPRPVTAWTKQMFCPNCKGNTGINSELACRIQERRNARCLGKFSLKINLRF